MSEQPAKKPKLVYYSNLSTTSVSQILPPDIILDDKYLVQVDEGNQTVFITIPPDNAANKAEMSLISKIVSELNISPAAWRTSIVRLLKSSYNKQMFEGGTEYYWERSNPFLKTVIVVKKIHGHVAANKEVQQNQPQIPMLPPKPVKPAIRNPPVKAAKGKPTILKKTSNILHPSGNSTARVENPTISVAGQRGSSLEGIEVVSGIYHIPNSTCCRYAETPVTSGRQCVPRKLKFRKSLKSKLLFPSDNQPLPVPGQIQIDPHRALPIPKTSQNSTALILIPKYEKYSKMEIANSFPNSIPSVAPVFPKLISVKPVSKTPSTTKNIEVINLEDDITTAYNAQNGHCIDSASTVYSPDDDDPPFKIIDWSKDDVFVNKDQNGRIYFSQKAGKIRIDILENYYSYLTKDFVFPHDNWNVRLTPMRSTQKCILEIYELNNNYEPLTILRSIRMITDGTVDIMICGKDCTEEFLKKTTIENSNDLKELIQLLSTSSICAGSIGFDIVALCEKAAREGKVWYSEDCCKVLFNSSTDSTCSPCQLVRNILRIEKAKMYRQVKNMEQESLQEAAANSDGTNPQGKELGRAIYDLIGGFWEEMKIEDAKSKLANEKSNSVPKATSAVASN